MPTPERTAAPAAPAVPSRPARRAFATLAAKEARAWRRSHAWWSQPAIFTLLLAGAMALLPLGILRETFAGEPGGVIGGAVSMFMSLGAVAPVFGAIFWFQNALVGERQAGTAAWVLSKPVPRWTLPTAKLAVNGGLLVAASLVVPGTVAYGVLALETGGPPSLGTFVAGLLVLVLHTAFYAALTLAMGALTDARGAVLAVPIAVLLLGDALVGVAPVLGRVSPWLLGRGAGLVAQGQAFPEPAALLATATLTAALIAAALVRFGRQDL